MTTRQRWTARTTGLALVAMLALASPAVAGAYAPSQRAPAAIATGADGGLRTAPAVLPQCPCNPDLPRVHGRFAVQPISAVQCPCNPDLPRTGGSAVRAAPASARSSHSEQRVRREAAMAPSDTFHWADASLGAAFAGGLALLGASALALTRRRLHRPGPA
jgi:hypothetical protein